MTSILSCGFLLSAEPSPVGKLALSKGYFASVVEIDPTNEEAKGLMDIMANLERSQPGNTESELEPEPEPEKVSESEKEPGKEKEIDK